VVAGILGGLALLLLIFGISALRHRGRQENRRVLPTLARVAKSRGFTTTDLVIEAYWCKTAIKLPTKLQTPLGGNVTMITVCVDIHFVVEGDNIALRRVQLSGAGGIMGSGSPVNVAARRRGEAWYATGICPESTLKEVVESDLASEKSPLRRMMLAKRRDANRPPA